MGLGVDLVIGLVCAKHSIDIECELNPSIFRNLAWKDRKSAGYGADCCKVGIVRSG